MQAVVSIVIPCRNAAPMLRHCLASCERQTYPAVEIVVVDNGSTDGSQDIVSSWRERSERKVVLGTCDRVGAAAARNVGLSLATGHYVQWLDADDELHPAKLERQIAALEADPSKDFAWSDWLLTRWQNGAPVGHETIHEAGSDDFFLDLLLRRWRPCCAYLYRRTLADRLAAAGLWHEGAREGDDREYIMSAALLGDDVYVADALSSYNQWSSGQLVRLASAEKTAQGMRAIFARVRARAAEAKPGRIGDAHAWLLEQTWDLYRMGNVQIDRWGTTVRVFHPESGERNVLLSPAARQALFFLLLRPPTKPMVLEDISCEVEGGARGHRRASLAMRRAVGELVDAGVLVRVDA